ncbi:MAG: hypothetical protein HC842_04010 [Cytophagales bacterium]|nr:hypothetical protein [Cytophagales bacterium]
MDYLLIAGIAIILLFILFVLSGNQRRHTDYFLVVVNLLIAGFLASELWVSHELTSFSFVFQNTLSFFIFPSFVIYALHFVNGGGRFDRRWWLLFLPGLFFLGYAGVDHWVVRGYSPAELAELFERPGWVYLGFYKLMQLLFMAVLIWLVRAIHRFKRDIKEAYSFVEPITLDWLLHFAMVYLFILMVSFFVFLMVNLRLIPLDIAQGISLINGLLVPTIFYMNFHGIRHYTVAQYYQQALPKPRTEHLAEAPTKAKYQSSGLREEKAKQVQDSLAKLLAEEKLYLQAQLKLQEVADALGESTHTLSQVINTREGKSFYDLVNEYRVEHLKKAFIRPRPAALYHFGLGAG